MKSTLRLAEAYYEDNQIDVAQQRIAKLKTGIDKERQRITQRRAVIRRRKEQQRLRKRSGISTT